MPPKSNTISDKVAFIMCESSDVILYLGRVSKSANDEPANTGSSVLKYKRLDEFLDWLETNHITREMKDRTGLDKVLKSLYSKSDWHFPKRYQDRAKSLIRRFEAEGWGEDEDNVSSSHSRPAERQRSIASATMNFLSARSTDAVIRLPPPNHSIWGVEGIYHGVALKVKAAGRGKTRRSLVLDSRYANERKNAKVIGHNGIEVGDWYPKQLVALFHGAHGHQQSGICGDLNSGAYSIVVAGFYDSLDHDNGKTLYYSGSGSHENSDPRNPPERTSGTSALVTSMENGTPVRVLRAHSGKSRYAPLRGIRYDGLYYVIQIQTPINEKGGLYEQFLLVRLDGQHEINVNIPNQSQVRDDDDSGSVNFSSWPTL